MKIKKIPKKLALWILMGGASLIVGLLSFSGMLALGPSLTIAGISFGLAVAFEGEVYYQNIKQALKKIFKWEFHARELAKEYLLTHFPKTTPRPEFFRDYQAKLQSLHQFKHKECNEKETIEKQLLEQELDDLEKWFAIQLFSTAEPDKNSPYQKELRTWLARNGQNTWQDLLNTQRKKFRHALFLSIVAGLFMCFGASYLLLEAFAVIPFTVAISITVWPILIAPLALIAGTAYGLLTFNAFTDMVSKNTLLFWKERFEHYLGKKWQDWKPNGIFIAMTELLLFSLIVALTLCTAGTWRTIALQTPPLFAWMSKMPTFIMGFINPIITSLTMLAFNVQNTSETLELIEKANRYTVNSLPKFQPPRANGTYDETWRNNYVFVESSKRLMYVKEDGFCEEVYITDLQEFILFLQAVLGGKKMATITPDEIYEHITLNGGHTPQGNVFTRFAQSIKDSYSQWRDITNPWHKWNPFRIFINLTYNPLHRSLFVGHLTSSAVTADRVQGIPGPVSAAFGFLSDGAVDAHYFIPHPHAQHDHSMEALLSERLKGGGEHNHETDFPTRLLKIAFFPIHLLADGWDWSTTAKEERTPFSMSRIWTVLMNGPSHPINEHSHAASSEGFLPKTDAWPLERAIYRIERYKEKQLQQAHVGHATAQEKIDHLTVLQQELRSTKLGSKVMQTIRQTINDHLGQSTHKDVYKKHRFFDYGQATGTTTFVEQDLLRRVIPRAGSV